MFKMPFRRDNMRQKPFQLLRIVEQFYEQTAQIPLIEHIAHIKDYRVDFSNGSLSLPKQRRAQLALACLEPAIRLVDHIGATTATDYATIPVTVFKRLQRVADFHFGTTP